MRSTLLSALAIACAACSTVPGTGPIREYTIDQVIPLPPSGEAAVGAKSGPFELVRVHVDNRPEEREVALGKDRPGDSSRPKPIVVVRSAAQHTARVSLATILEDEAGEPLMTCKSRLDQDLAPGFEDDWNTCQLESMRTGDWARVKRLHAILGFQVREDVPGATPPKPTRDIERPKDHCGGQPSPKDCGD